MPKFVAIPKNDLILSEIAIMPQGFTPEARALRIEAMRDMRLRSGSAVFADETVEFLNKSLNTQILTAPDDPLPITGITVLEGEPDSLQSLQEQMPDHDVYEDFPLGLVLPEATGSTASKPEEVDDWHLRAIGLTAARKKGFAGHGNGIGIAVLDTGIEPVPEIEGRIVESWEIGADGKARQLAKSADTHGHGTHVAGLIAGQNIGVAPGAKLLDFVMIPRNQGTFADFVVAINFVAQRPEFAVMSMSVGIPGYKPEMRKSVQGLVAAGVMPVIAIGNEGVNTSRSPGNYTESFSVGASNEHGRIWNRSGGGQLAPDAMIYATPDVVAPGEEVTSCVRTGGYEAWSGTSMATPIVAGMAALIIEKYGMISEGDLREEILGACSHLSGVADIRQGAGLVQIPTHLWFTGS